MALQTWSCEQSHAQGKRARLETSYFYPLPSPNANSLGDDLLLFFVFCYGSLQTTTNAKSICQSLWRCSNELGIIANSRTAWQKPDRTRLPVPRAIRTFLRAIYASSIAKKPPGPQRVAVRSRSKLRGTPSRAPALHAPPSAADRDRLHRVKTPYPRAAVPCRSQATPSRRKLVAPSFDNKTKYSNMCAQDVQTHILSQIVNISK